MKEYNNSKKDHSMKDGQKIHIAVSKVSNKKGGKKGGRSSASNGAAGGGFLKPSSKDTTRRMSASGS